MASELDRAGAAARVHSRRVRTTVLRGALAAVLVVGVSTTASAQTKTPNAADRETARSLMDEGRTKAQAKDLKGALAAYKAADAIMHVPTTGLAVARTQAALGLLVEARDTALGVTRIPVVGGEPPVIAEGRKAADDLASELSPRIPTLKIGISVPAGIKPDVTVDDVTVSYDALVAPRRLNPGHHVVLAKVGTVERKAEVDLVEKDSKTVQLDFPADLKPPVVAVVPVAGQPAQPGQPAEPTAAKGMSPLVYVGIGVGGAGLLVGLGAGFLSLSKTSSAKDDCRDNQCPPSTHGDLDSATTFAVVSNIGFVVAGAGAITAVVGYFMSRSKTETKTAILDAPAHPTPVFRARPYVGAGQLGMSGEF